MLDDISHKLQKQNKAEGRAGHNIVTCKHAA